MRTARITREQIDLTEQHSFRLLLTPNLNDQYYWHFHPEYEICYVEGASGTRHIGDHISRYEGSDLVFIGPYIPHLNFDYGVRTKCEQVVVQMREDFLGDGFLALPELGSIRALFSRAGQALAFFGETKDLVGKKLKALPECQSFERLLALLEIFNLLAASREVEELGAQPLQNRLDQRNQHRLGLLHRLVEERYPEAATTDEAAAAINLSTPAFCRYFKRATGLTFTDYTNKYRINQARKLLLMERNVTEACFASGFQNLSHFNRTFKRFAGENPSAFRKKVAKNFT